jgi:ribonuclease BN (tRNA processing enzyme)
MKIHLLGTAGYHPNERRHTACFMIPETGMIFDAGTGFFRVRDLIQTPDLHVYLSHSHLDHCVGLSFYYNVIRQRDVRNLFVYGEPQKLQAVREHLFSEHLFPSQPDFHWEPLTDQPLSVPSGGEMTTFPLIHPGGSRGFRIEWPGHSLAYVTDTTAMEGAAYIDCIRDVNLLLHECNFSIADPAFAIKTGHSCLADVARVCKLANAGKTVLVHHNPLDSDPLDLTSVRPLYDRFVSGEDHMVVDF